MKSAIVSFIVSFLFIADSIFAVTDSVYYNFYVKHSDNTYCTHTAPTVSYFVYINNMIDYVLTDNAARWDASGAANIDGSGKMGIELGYFQDKVKAGDSVYINVVCSQSQEEGLLVKKITGIPWITPPATLTLQKKTLPQTPQNVKVAIDDQTSNRVITWDYVAGNTYFVFRRTMNAKLPNGLDNCLYELVAPSITTGAYTDTETDESKHYLYIIAAMNADGIVRSEEIRDDIIPITGLTVEAKPNTVKLVWNAPVGTESPVNGYNIYRRTESGSFVLVAYAGKDTMFVDSRLSNSTKYYYKVKARYNYTTEVAESGEISATTTAASNQIYNYLTLRVAVVIYKSTNRDPIYDSEIANMKKALELARLFYWRNSNMKLNVAFDYHVISNYTEFADPMAHGTNMQQTVSDLKNRGVINTQYDVIFRITTATDGYFSYGAPTLALDGPSRATGFSWVQWPVGTGVIYPGNDATIPYGLTWVFTHEVQHAIDGILDGYGNSEDEIMYHGDNPWLFPGACGEQFDFQSKMFRSYTSYEYVDSDWGEVYQSVDNDKDGFPDNDPLVPLDEARFGSSAENADTDGDGLKDKSEAIDGAFGGSLPLVKDTDGDGVNDGSDNHPRYSGLQSIPNFKPVIDGTIDANWPVFATNPIYSETSGFAPKMYLSYDADSLYAAVSLPLYAVPEFTFEFEGDGFWHGMGNTYIKIDMTNFKITQSKSYLTTDAVRQVADWGMWDNETNYIVKFGDKKVFPVSSLRGKGSKNGNTYQFEFAIPKNDTAGLKLKAGDSIGVNLYYNNVGYSGYATQFDQYEFAYYKLGQSIGVEENNNDLIPAEYSLGQNYPNPFNPATKISYALPEGGRVKLNIYDSLGRLVTTLVDEERAAGRYEVMFNASNLSSGIYFYEIVTKNFRSAKKMCLLK